MLALHQPLAGQGPCALGSSAPVLARASHVCAEHLIRAIMHYSNHFMGVPSYASTHVLDTAVVHPSRIFDKQSLRLHVLSHHVGWVPIARHVP